jgi:hypothetical protein
MTEPTNYVDAVLAKTPPRRYSEQDQDRREAAREAERAEYLDLFGWDPLAEDEDA